MPLDYRIPLSVETPKVSASANPLKDALDIQEARQKSQANAMKLQQAQREQQAQVLIANAYQHYYKDGKLDIKGLTGDLATSGFGDYIPDIEKTHADVQKHLFDATEAAGKADAAQRDAAGRIGSVADKIRKSGRPNALQEAAGYLITNLPDIHQRNLMTDQELVGTVSKLTDPNDKDSINSVIDALMEAPEQVKLARERATTAETGLDIADKTAKAPFVAPAAEAAMRQAQAKASEAEQVTAGMQGGLTPQEQSQAANQAAVLARQTAANAETARHNRAEEAKARTAASGGTSGGTSDVKETIAGMKDGSLPPILPGRATKEYTAMLAEAHRQGYNLSGAATDWMATQKHIATMNGAQQLRLNQAINQLPELLDTVDALASKWKGGRFPLLNKANLALAKGGAFGKDVASVANQLDAQIADVTADLGNVYMGGNSPTDHALDLAAKGLAANWDEKVLHDMTNLARNNVKIRRNSINNTGVAGASSGNTYAPPQTQPPSTDPNDPLGLRK